MSVAGFGDSNALFKVYIGNRPSYKIESQTQSIRPLKTREIYDIGQACGNGWRKVFNVYAKLLYALSCGAINGHSYQSWQQYRDNALLQESSATALLFSAPDFTHANALHMIMGRTYANTLSLPPSLVWLNKEFAIDKINRLIVCPYFDYRQLSNHKIIFLVDLIKQEFGACLLEP
ncbi:hypothetical protein CA267_006165 [Alteromonas pelagimontana]|uniref:Uncharacterized protein n=1 Tax=Alteromonas pelagimontana TaxID=1858656 RepID=A0A6M4MC55_9ALTE|nr:hypothetical protein [Alteromonas pelagimontana]QJR80388.1 hypothetical protein CA267_006165 [Alteromonas pelagimontana]